MNRCMKMSIVVCLSCLILYYLNLNKFRTLSTVAEHARGTEIIDSRKSSCNNLVQEYQYLNVTDNLLAKLQGTCSKNKTGNMLSNSFLEESILKLTCPRSAGWMDVKRPLVALASYPGSGNTWTRQLIETITGNIRIQYICMSSSA